MKFRKGFTLIELIISFALIGIIAVSSLTIFDTGLSNIVRAGSRTKAVTTASHDVYESSVIETANITVKVNSPILGDSFKEYNIVGNVEKGIGSVPAMSGTTIEVEIFEFKPQ